VVRWQRTTIFIMSEKLRESLLQSGQQLSIRQGDLTEEKVDAIVNAANAQLQHGGGVAAAIARVGGPVIQKESDDWFRTHGPVSHDRPAFTSGGSLPCRYVIHAVGPVWGEGQEDDKLADAVSGSLTLADSLDLGSIAFPAISTGIFGFPKRRAAAVILSAIRDYFASTPDSGLTSIRLILFDSPTVDAFLEVWDEAAIE
jgi:O-acetyl-ADP-ribose deacetylase